MKALLLLSAACMVGYFVYRDYFAVTEPVKVATPTATPLPTPTPTPTPTPAPAPIPFAAKSAVRSLYDEWKRRELGDQRSTMPEPRKLFIEIKRHLFSKGEHTDAAVKRTIVQVLGEMGFPPDEREHIAGGIMSMR